MERRSYYQHLSVDNSSVSEVGSSEDLDSIAMDGHEHQDHLLSVRTGAALLTADCMGTGILALPHDMKVLGSTFGMVFIVFNLIVNFYAGVILCRAATHVELATTAQQDSLHEVSKSYQATAPNEQLANNDATVDNDEGSCDVVTADFISMTRALFDSQDSHPSTVTVIVTTVYYVNIFLVLGNYVLVMSHAVLAMLADQICLPVAGIIASLLMFAVSQLRTMARLGRSASIISLAALAILVIQCISPLLLGHYISSTSSNDFQGERILNTSDSSVLRKFAAASSIGFAVGSQKLLLNIRHEFYRRSDTTQSLAIALSVFGGIYILVCILAGTGSLSRRLAGFLLWVHVSVSFAINSQALCSSIDRTWFRKCTFFSLHSKHATRWALLSLLLSVSSYTVANAIPFFADLVSFIGALTSVPLTLLLPAIFHRKVLKLPLFILQNIGNAEDTQSFCLAIFAILFLVLGVSGSIASIQQDWADHGRNPFSC